MRLHAPFRRSASPVNWAAPAVRCRSAAERRSCARITSVGSEADDPRSWEFAAHCQRSEGTFVKANRGIVPYRGDRRSSLIPEIKTRPLKAQRPRPVASVVRQREPRCSHRSPCPVRTGSAGGSVPGLPWPAYGLRLWFPRPWPHSSACPGPSGLQPY